MPSAAANLKHTSKLAAAHETNHAEVPRAVTTSGNLTQHCYVCGYSASRIAATYTCSRNSNHPTPACATSTAE
jgi:hypothetical protein